MPKGKMPDWPEDAHYLKYHSPNGEIFVWHWVNTPSASALILQEVAKFAADPRINFTWFEAAKVSTIIRQNAND